MGRTLSLRNRRDRQFERVTREDVWQFWTRVKLGGSGTTSLTWAASARDGRPGVGSAAAHPLHPCFHLPSQNLHIHPESGKVLLTHLTYVARNNGYHIT